MRAVDKVSQLIKTQYQKMVGKKIIEITKIIIVHLICCLLCALYYCRFKDATKEEEEVSTTRIQKKKGTETVSCCNSTVRGSRKIVN
jgi:hypothetical protein